MPKNVTVFTTTHCAYCGMVKKFLDMKGLNYEVVNLDENPEKRAEIVAMSGATTVPITIVTKQDDSRDVIVGYNLSRLAPAVA
jgi:glutaredoxin 3